MGLRYEHGEPAGGGHAGIGFDQAVMETLEPLAEKYGLFVAERTCWHVLFRGAHRILDVACDPWTCWALGARVGMWSESDSGSRHGDADAAIGQRGLSVQDVLHAVYGMRENAWPWMAASPTELRAVLHTLAGLVDRYCAELFLDDEAFARAERLVASAAAEREAFVRQFEDR